MQKSKGFTLIELLVVIAIIAILAAILFPVFARARENARRASCQSNLKQIALGVFQYTQDYDEKMPILYADLDGASGYQAPADGASAPYDLGWAKLLDPYLKSSQIFQCPSETTTPTAGATITGGANYTDFFYNSVAAGQSQAQFDSTSLTVMLGDFGSGSSVSYTNGGCAVNSGGDGCAASDLTNPLAAFPTGVALRHLDGQNYAYADGHVKWAKGAATTAGSSSTGVYNGAYGTANGSPTFRLLSPNAS